MIDPAELPEKPASPSIPKNTLLGLFLGGFLAVAALLLRDLLDSTFKTAEQVEKDFGIPILGTIPTIEVSQSAR